MPKVSFVVAVYGVEDYIEECVRSLYGQTLEDIEVVLVDDCTPDKSIEIALKVLDEFPHRKEQVKVVRHERNQGQQAGRKSGVAAATGEYVIYIDGDDWVETCMAEKMYNKAVEENADMVLCGFWRYGRNDRHYQLPLPLDSLGDTETIKDATLGRVGWPNVWCRMIRREILSSDKMVWPTATHAEDVVISAVTTYYSQTITFVDEPLYHYRYNSHSISNVKNESIKVKRYRDYVENNELLADFYEQNGLNEKYPQAMIVNKSYARNEILPLAGKRKYRKLWRKTYPELNRIMLFKSTYREVIWLMAVSLGLYPRFKRYLLSKRLRPALVWRREF